ncbi:MAG: hypothetical protein LBC56_07930 [Oscillospiraceae bacterium]|jgi:V/A-type H+-transporting ATPase subunit I|nr:hypothetical protein [Oscillospiraceae bacterium]
MGITKMMIANINGDADSLDQVLLGCMKSGVFHPEQSHSPVSGGVLLSQSNPYEPVLKKLTDTAMHLGIGFDAREFGDAGKNRVNYVDNLEDKILQIRKHREELAGLIKRNEGISIKPEEIFRTHMLIFRVGRLSAIGVKKLKRDKDDMNKYNIHFVFPWTHKYSWCAYVTTESKKKDIDAYFYNLGMERVMIPDNILENINQIHLYEEQNESTDINTAEVKEYLDKIDKEILALNRKKEQIQSQLIRNEQLITQLSHIENLDVTFDDLFSCEYIDIRFGRLPKDSYAKLKYYEDEMFILYAFNRNETEDDYYWCVYFSPRYYHKQIDAIFASLYFERIHIPDYVHSTLEESAAKVNKAISEGRKKLYAITAEINAKKNETKLYFFWLYLKLNFLSRSFSLRKYVNIYEDTFYFEGFVPSDQALSFKDCFNNISGVSVTLRPTDSEPGQIPPTKLSNSRFSAAFEMFTTMYGTPQYDEIDPTPFLAVTYTILFGAMFGDFGQGVCLFLLGVYLWAAKGSGIGRVMQRLGISSAVFGLFYGEFFGYSGIVHVPGLEIELMDSSSTNAILMTAMGAGAILLVVSMIINITVSLRKKSYGRAFLSRNGLAGLVFYIALMSGLALERAIPIFMPDLLPTPVKFFDKAPLVIFLIVLPALLMFFQEPLGELISGRKKPRFENGIGGFILSTFFEMFETMLSFMTNTLSFLRVGGFVLSHAGLMSVVRLLSEMVSGEPGGVSIPVVIFGNIFVMALEGLIVGIQTLRLEFYEMFSHFVEGAGKEFTPVNFRRS